MPKSKKKLIGNRPNFKKVVKLWQELEDAMVLLEYLSDAESGFDEFAVSLNNKMKNVQKVSNDLLFCKE